MFAGWSSIFVLRNKFQFNFLNKKTHLFIETLDFRYHVFRTASREIEKPDFYFFNFMPFYFYLLGQVLHNLAFTHLKEQQLMHLSAYPCQPFIEITNIKSNFLQGRVISSLD